MPPFSIDIVTDPHELARFKQWISETTALSHDALHMHAGLFLFALLLVAFGRTRWGGLAAWGILFIIALWVEWMDFQSLTQTDYADYFQGGDDAGLHDVINTMLWPTILLGIGPWLFRKWKKTRFRR